MKNILFLFFVFFMFSVSAMGVQYVVDLEYSEGAVNVTNVDFSFNSQISMNQGKSLVQVRSYDKEVLFERNIDLSNNILTETFDSNGEIISFREVNLSGFNFSLVLPYFEEAAMLVFYNEDLDVIGIYDLGKYSTEYRADEVIFSTPVVINKSGSEKEVFRDKEISKKSIFDYWWMLVVIVCLFAIALIRSLKKSSKK